MEEQSKEKQTPAPYAAGTGSTVGNERPKKAVQNKKQRTKEKNYV